MKNLIISLLAILGIVSLIGCKDKEADLTKEKEAIIGTWVQIEPSCINCDTLVFSNHNSFKSSEENYNYLYNFIDKSLIQIDRGILVDNYKYQFSNSYSTFLIEDYFVNLTGFGDIDIVLNKID